MVGFCVFLHDFCKKSDNLLPSYEQKTKFSNMASVRHVEFDSLNFSHSTLVTIVIFFSVSLQILSKSNDILRKYCVMSSLKLAVVRHLRFSKYEIVDIQLCIISPRLCIFIQIARKSNNPLPTYDPKRRLPTNMAVVRHLEFTNLSFCSNDYYHNHCLIQCTEFHHNRIIFH